MAYQPLGLWQIAATLLLVGVFVLDGIDGHVARRRGEESAFGAMLDIALDRIVELSMWMTLASLQAAPLWVGLLFLVRGGLVDAIRARRVAEDGTAPFDALRHPLARWLVKGRFMRGFYAAIKAITFCWLLFFLPMPVLLAETAPALWSAVAPYATLLGTLLIWLSALLCVVRGLPVVMEYAHVLRHSGRAQHG